MQIAIINTLNNINFIILLPLQCLSALLGAKVLFFGNNQNKIAEINVLSKQNNRK